MSETAVDEKGAEEAGFAAMMALAAGQAAGPAEEAPYGYTTDKDGSTRPKKTAGRPRRSPPVEELRAQREAGDAPETRAGDRAPDTRRRRARKGGADDKPAPQFREGVIAKGINKLYRRGGKLVRVMDRDTGQALIDITRKDLLEDGTPDPEDITVGEAWEELARANPRIRAFLMRVIAGGAWGQLFMAHAPVLLAVMMKDAIRRRIPFTKLIEAFLEQDTEQGGDGAAPADGTPFEGLTMPDMETMMAMARQMAEQAVSPRAPGATLRAPGPGPDATAAGPAASGS